MGRSRSPHWRSNYRPDREFCGACQKVIHPNEIEAVLEGKGLYAYECDAGFWHTTKKPPRYPKDD